MLEKSSTECVNIGIRVFDLADGSENTRNGIETSPGEVANIIVLDVLVSKSFQMHESGISVSENSMAISWDDSAFTKSLSDELFDNLRVGLFSFVVVLERSQPLETFLIGKTMKRSSKTVHGS